MPETISSLELKGLVALPKLDTPQCKCVAQMSLRHPSDRERVCAACRAVRLEDSRQPIPARPITVSVW